MSENLEDKHLYTTDIDAPVTVDDLELTDEQKARVLEWFAVKLFVLLEGAGRNYQGNWKSYDPMRIEGKVAHTYVFDLDDGGRHHPFESFRHLEEMLLREGIKQLRALEPKAGG